MTIKIGYYVHHQGMGHLSRALAIATHLPGQLTLLGTGLAGRCGDIPYIDLPDDRDPGMGLPQDIPDALHYAPLGCEGIRQRAAAITGWIASNKPALLVVDVSVEIAMLARLASTPVLYVRLAGNRGDVAHLEAFRSACALMAPFHHLLDDRATATWVREKTRYIAGLTAPMPILAPRQNTVLLVLGTGGTAITGAEIASAAAATPDWQWRVAGLAPTVPNAPPNLQSLGWVTDVAREIATAEIVIGAAGDGVVNAVLAAGRPFICLPQNRPYGEQKSKSERLAATGAAITLDAWPEGAAWRNILLQARQLQPERHRYLHDPDGVQRAAEFIAELATRG